MIILNIGAIEPQCLLSEARAVVRRWNHASIAGIVMVRNIRIESLKAIGCLGSQIAMTMKIKDKS